jgi:hypothetical protein
VPVTTLQEESPYDFEAVYSYDVDATDPDGDVIQYSLLLGPSGMTINPVTGLISWKPGKNQAGSVQVKVKASDGGLYDTQTFTITVLLPEKDKYPRRTIFVESIRMNNQVYDLVHPGDELLVDTTFEDIGVYNIKDATIRVTVEGLGISRKIGPFIGPKVEKEMTKGVLLEIPTDAKKGVYTARITLRTDDGLIRTKHRDLKVI